MAPASPYRIPGERPAVREPQPRIATTPLAADSEAELAAVAYEDDSREQHAGLPTFIILALIGGLSLVLVVAILLAGPR